MRTRKNLGGFVSLQSTTTLIFSNSINNINKLYNQQFELITDGEYIYLDK